MYTLNTPYEPHSSRLTRLSGLLVVSCVGLGLGAYYGFIWAVIHIAMRTR